MRLYVAYNSMYVLGMLLAMQIRFVGFQHVQSGEHMAAMGVFFLLQVGFLVAFSLYRLIQLPFLFLNGREFSNKFHTILLIITSRL